MGVTSITERVRRAIEAAAAEARATRDPVRGTDPASDIAYDNGVSTMIEELRELLDVGPHEDPPDEALLDAIETYCRDHCAWSRSREPGSALKCKACPLREHALDNETKAEDAAKEAADERRRG